MMLLARRPVAVEPGIEVMVVLKAPLLPRIKIKGLMKRVKKVVEWAEVLAEVVAPRLLAKPLTKPKATLKRLKTEER